MPTTSSGTSRPIAPLEYTLTSTLPAGSSTNPVDCRKTGSGLTNAPVEAEIAAASAPCPTGKLRRCLATVAAGVCSSSTDNAVTFVPTSASSASSASATQLIATYEGATVLTHSLRDPDLMHRQSQRLRRWVESLDTTNN